MTGRGQLAAAVEQHTGAQRTAGAPIGEQPAEGPVGRVSHLPSLN